MFRLLSRRRFLRLGIAGTLSVGSGGCGTILYPERIGQPPGMLDWKVVALDTIGLLLFLVPGVIAVVVDFYNHTIYLPQGYYGEVTPDRRKQLVAVRMLDRELGQEAVEQAVAQHTGHSIRLVSGEFRTQQLATMDEFWTAHDVLAKRAA